MEKAEKISSLIKIINAAKKDISDLIDRPSNIQSIGEGIAADILGINYEDTAPHLTRKGYFCKGPLKNKSVTIEWYLTKYSCINQLYNVDFVVLMVGLDKYYRTPYEYPSPWLINSVYLLNLRPVLDEIDWIEKGQVVDIHIKNEEWKGLEIFPESNSPLMELSEEQKNMFRKFSG